MLVNTDKKRCIVKANTPVKIITFADLNTYQHAESMNIMVEKYNKKFSDPWRSSEGLKPYKRICEEQKQQVSDVLNDATNGAVKKIKLSERVPPFQLLLTAESSSDQEPTVST